MPASTVGRRIVERLRRPDAEALERQRLQHLQPFGRQPRAADVEPLQVLQLRELRDTEIAELQSAGQRAVAAARRRGLSAHAELDADAEVELLEARQQRDRVEIEIGDVRRPARAGVSPLHALQAERLQLRQQLQEIQVEPGDQRGADLQVLELAQIRQMLEADVAEHRVADVERPQPRHLADVRHARVGDVDAAHDQPPQRAIRAQMRHRRVGQELRRVEREVFELLKRLQLLDAAIGDVGERQIELLDRLELDDEVDVVVGRPRALERRLDDGAVLVARDPAAALLDALDGIGDGGRIDCSPRLRRGRAGRRQRGHERSERE